MLADQTGKDNSICIAGVLIALQVLVSLYDLFSPPISSTIWRQTQTAMLTGNFVKYGFHLSGLYADLNGNQPLLMVYEFPIYNFIVGLFFIIINNSFFWGKLVSLASSIISLLCLFRLFTKLFSRNIAILSGLFFIFSPIGVLMTTSFQPDSLGLMFLLISIYFLVMWREKYSFKFFLFFAFFLLAAGLTKIPIIVPYIPLIAIAILFRQGMLRRPQYNEIIAFSFVFIVPILIWYIYRGSIMDSALVKNESGMFLFGDLSRFLKINFYVKPFYMLFAYIWCGSGAIFFFSGLKQIRGLDVCLLLGISIYFIVIPTVSDQHYYLYACLPIFCLFMAHGLLALYRCSLNHKLVFIIYGCLVVYLCGFLVSATYLLRHDKVVYSAAKELNEVSEHSDLSLFIGMHDRVNLGGFYDPSFFYLSERKGWNIVSHGQNIKSVLKDVLGIREQRVPWLVLTWYTPDLEPWFEPFIPKNLKRDPGINGQSLLLDLIKHYSVVRIDQNYAILKLRYGR